MYFFLRKLYNRTVNKGQKALHLCNVKGGTNMENFIFENSTKAYFGKGCVSQYLPDVLKQYGENVMLAYGGGSIKRNGIYEEIKEILKAAGKTVTEFSGIISNPVYTIVLEGAKLAK